MFKHPAYIVLEIPSPMAEEVAKLRKQADAAFPQLPVETTIAGSSGVGPVEPEQSPEDVFAILDGLACETASFDASFQSIERFPDSPVMFLSLVDPAPFVALHQAIIATTIRFRPSSYPFGPHCTIRSQGAGALDEIEIQRIKALPVPRNRFLLETISIYELDAGKRECRLLHRAPFNAR